MSPPTGFETVLDAAPASLPPIDPAVGGLSRARAGSSALFVEGRRAYVQTGTSRDQGTTIVIDGVPTLRDLRAPLGAVANIHLTPGLLRRERVGARGTVTETVLVAPTLPLIWIEWSTAGSPLPGDVLLTLDHEVGEGAPTTLAQTERGIVLAAGGGRALAITACGGSVRVRREGPNLAVNPDVRASTGRLTLVLAVGTPRELRTALVASAHVGAHAIRAASGPEGGTVLQTGVAEVDEGFAWARARVEGSAFRHRATLPLGLGALAGGDEASARQVLDRLRPRTVEHALLAGRFAATFGDSGPALSAAGALVATEGRSGPAGPRALAARSLSEALRYAAPDAVTAELATIGRSLRSPERSGRALPMAGPRPAPREPAPEAESAWLAGLFEGRPSHPPGEAVRPSIVSIRESSALFATDPDSAWVMWRGLLDRGLQDGPAGPATWDTPEESATDGPACAELVQALMHGMLGVAPDAPVGRIRIAPRFPGHLRSFTVGGIALGETRLRLAYERRGDRHRFTVAPEHAAVPPLLVLEPTVRGRIRSIRIDGEPAELDVRETGLLSTVPVQLPVDGERTLDVTAEAPS